MARLLNESGPSFVVQSPLCCSIVANGGPKMCSFGEAATAPAAAAHHTSSPRNNTRCRTVVHRVKGNERRLSIKAPLSHLDDNRPCCLAVRHYRYTQCRDTAAVGAAVSGGLAASLTLDATRSLFTRTGGQLLHFYRVNPGFRLCFHHCQYSVFV